MSYHFINLSVITWCITYTDKKWFKEFLSHQRWEIIEIHNLLWGGFSSVHSLHPSFVYREVAPAWGGDYSAIEKNINIDIDIEYWEMHSSFALDYNNNSK